MRKIRLAILGESPCGHCHAACCKQNGHAYAVLLRGDEVRRFAPWAVDVPISQGDNVVIERVITYRDGRCPFLGDDDRCTIYESRPQSCRIFQCIDFLHRDGLNRHGEFLNRNPRVLQMLVDL
jgi:Fe-S-cluster containining protein